MRTLEIVKPQSVEFDRKASTTTYGVFTAQPFERGWGVTVGNALRRILLSSIEGAAVTAVRINGVAHELDSVPGLVEDVTDFILNLKRVPLRLHSGVKTTATISVTGPGTITAADIKAGSELEVVDQSVYLGQLSEKTKLEAELIIERGRGWVPSEERRDEERGIGFIPVDASFSPVRKANFRIEPARVGQATDYEKLILEIWTNGAITPHDALVEAAQLLSEHLAIFGTQAPLGTAAAGGAAGKLGQGIEVLELAKATETALRNAGILTLRDLVARTEDELLELPRLGKTAVSAIKKALDREGLALGMPVSGA
ncbi:MAG: DNA-directed RNA polymerase subunit alpha [Thermoanaerobaculum sp.]|uniref:DNA-directed RNA polymerase subunit alpha n=1 Tax=Thermoanaerobaculum aquaticum TaxID=1312852 RepID=A0A7V2EET5_9BACT|nr:MAG: DNA-directed RNA polymerase subunit alpha [Thermoanaerobaculum sp.]